MSGSADAIDYTPEKSVIAFIYRGTRSLALIVLACLRFGVLLLACSLRKEKERKRREREREREADKAQDDLSLQSSDRVEPVLGRDSATRCDKIPDAPRCLSAADDHFFLSVSY